MGKHKHNTYNARIHLEKRNTKIRRIEKNPKEDYNMKGRPYPQLTREEEHGKWTVRRKINSQWWEEGGLSP